MGRKGEGEKRNNDKGEERGKGWEWKGERVGNGNQTVPALELGFFTSQLDLILAQGSYFYSY